MGFILLIIATIFNTPKLKGWKSGANQMCTVPLHSFFVHLFNVTSHVILRGGEKGSFFASFYTLALLNVLVCSGRLSTSPTFEAYGCFLIQSAFFLLYYLVSKKEKG